MSSSITEQAKMSTKGRTVRKSTVVVEENRSVLTKSLPGIVNPKVEENHIGLASFNARPILKGEGNFRKSTMDNGKRLLEENGAPPRKVNHDVLQEEALVEKKDATKGVPSINGLLPLATIESTYKINGKKPTLAPLHFQKSQVNNANRKLLLRHTSLAAAPKENRKNGELEDEKHVQFFQVQPAVNSPVHKEQAEVFPQKQEPILAENTSDTVCSIPQANKRGERNGTPASYTRSSEAKNKPSLNFAADAIPNCAKKQSYCYICKKFVEKGSKLEVGATNWVLAGLLCSLGCSFGCCLVPFCLDSLKDEVEYCAECNSGLYMR